MKPRWAVKGFDAARAESLAGSLRVSGLLAAVLASRGFASAREAETFLNPRLSNLSDPFLMKGMEKAARRAAEALALGERIVVYGDYDADGVTSVCLVRDFMRRLGREVEYYIPHRCRDGYGLHAEALRKIAEAGPALVIVVDCGISSVEEAEVARAAGCSLVILDHHEPPVRLPEAAAVVDPKQEGCAFPFKEVAGCGIAFYFLAGLRRILRERGMLGEEVNLREYLDLVALGTMADVVPLREDNRIFMKYGIAEIEKSRRPGIKALLDKAAVGKVSGHSLAFMLAPRINAAGRMGDARRAVELLCARDAAGAGVLAEEIDQENRRRQDVEKTVLEEAVAQIEAGKGWLAPSSVVVCAPGWHRGVIGIVAARLVERFGRPAVVLSREEELCHGSARSVEGFDLFNGLCACREHLVSFGGHRCAAGLKVSAGNVAHFATAFDEAARGFAAEFMPRIDIDCEAEVGEITYHQVEQLEKLAPFGHGNPEPVFLARGVKILSPRDLKGGEHLRFSVRPVLADQPVLGAVWFRAQMSSQSLPQHADIAFTPVIHEWSGIRSVELRIAGVREADASPLDPRQQSHARGAGA